MDLPAPGIPEMENSSVDVSKMEKENIVVSQMQNSQKENQVPKARGRGRPRKSEIKGGNLQTVVKDESEAAKDKILKGIQGMQGVRKKDKKKIEEHELQIPERGENEIVFSPLNISAEKCEFL